MKVKLVIFLLTFSLFAQVFSQSKKEYEICCQNNPNRAWWDVQSYTLDLELNFNAKKIFGSNTISFIPNQKSGKMNIDLKRPGIFEKIIYHGIELLMDTTIPNLAIVQLNNCLKNKHDSITIYYSTQPYIAVKPPWDGGVIFTKDSTGQNWFSMAVQGDGLSTWLPCKDWDEDEPNNGFTAKIKVPKGMEVISNGRMIHKDTSNNIFLFKVQNPINPYNIHISAGNYKIIQSKYQSEVTKKPLDITFALIDTQIEYKTKYLTDQCFKMLHSFEDWFGPYPFYEDGYKIVETPFLGMEHQSCVAYGNQFKFGYSGRDLSHTGIGLKFDFIVVHESGHEWFANNISCKDVADMWIHEGFTCYSETIYCESIFNKKESFEYCRGEWQNIKNDKPIIGLYGQKNQGSGDMYYKGSAIIHMIRMMIDDDIVFKSMMRDMNKKFYHQMVDSKTIENYIQKYSKLPLDGFFNQYLRTTQIPKITFKTKGNSLEYTVSNTVRNFIIKIPFEINGDKVWATIKKSQGKITVANNIITAQLDENFLLQSEKLID